jgi:hypothetical protein
MIYRMVELENENGTHEYLNGSLTSKEKIKRLVKILLRLGAIHEFLHLQKTISLDMMNQMLFFFMNVMTVVNSFTFDAYYSELPILARGMISAAIPLLSLGYIEHIALSVKMTMTKKEMLAMLKKSLRHSLTITVAGHVPMQSHIFINQVVLPMYGRGRQLTALREQCEYLIQTLLTSLCLAVVEDSYKIVEPEKQMCKMYKIVDPEKQIRKIMNGMSKILDVIWKKEKGKPIKELLSPIRNNKKNNVRISRKTKRKV